MSREKKFLNRISFDGKEERPPLVLHAPYSEPSDRRLWVTFVSIVCDNPSLRDLEGDEPQACHGVGQKLDRRCARHFAPRFRAAFHEALFVEEECRVRLLPSFKNHVLLFTGEVREQSDARPLPIDAGYRSDTTRAAGVTLVAMIPAQFGKGARCVEGRIEFQFSRSGLAGQAQLCCQAGNRQRL